MGAMNPAQGSTAAVGAEPVVNALSLLFSACLCACVKEDYTFEQFMEQAFEIFDIESRGWLSFDETAVALLSAMKALDAMQGLNQASRMDDARAEDITLTVNFSPPVG